MKVHLLKGVENIVANSEMFSTLLNLYCFHIYGDTISSADFFWERINFLTILLLYVCLVYVCHLSV